MTDRKIAMISSTAGDLPEHREQVRLGCERAGFEPREMMEHLTALSKQLEAADTGKPGISAAAKFHRRTVIPAPPVPYVAHPYTLLQVRNLVKRFAENKKPIMNLKPWKVKLLMGRLIIFYSN